MARYVVTGGLGFLGQHIVNEILQAEEDCEIRVVSRSRQNKQLYLDILSDSRVRFIPSDLTKETAFEYLDGVDYVIHNAALVSFRESDKRRLYELNVGGTRRIIQACNQFPIKRFVYVSSTNTVGANGALDAPVDESHFLDPQDPRINEYAKSKILAEKLIGEEGDTLDYVIGNPSTILGPGDTKMLSFLRLLKRLPAVPAMGGIQNVIDVRDAAHGTYLIMKSGAPKERYLLTNHQIHVAELMQLMTKAMGLRRIVFKFPPSMIRLLKYPLSLYCKIVSDPMITPATLQSMCSNRRFSNAKIKRLGMRFKFPLEKTLADFVVWGKRHDERTQ